jgi:CDP-glucose 4,6-dehydratase
VEDLVAPQFSWKGRRVFLTGHTGFKGGWLALWLSQLGAEVRGYALDPATTPNFFDTVRLGELVEDIRGDIRNPVTLDEAILSFAPEVVFHLAAQPLVRLSYADPIGTYETNVIGTARVLNAIRRTPSVRAVVSVTTDKVYENRELQAAFSEEDRLGGHDPYSSSKACAEIVTAAFRSSYFLSGEVRIATARAGNVIGGGDWSTDRLLPDLVRGFLGNQPVPIRRPQAVRPWQHVLEPVHGYLLLAEKLLEDKKFATSYNFGPAEEDAKPVQWIADQMAKAWGEGASWLLDPDPGVHEAGYLRLDASRAKHELGWIPRLDLASALDLLVQWYRAESAGQAMRAFSLAQIAAYEALIDRT